MSSTVPKYLPKKPPYLIDRRWPNRTIERIFGTGKRRLHISSVDLRDGNQALPNPMDPQQKLEYFQLLCAIGFKEIEVAFPAASKDDYDFVRMLIEDGHIPDDVTIIVLTQCRDDLVAKTIESILGAKRVVIHSYIAMSDLHLQQVFGMSRERVIQKAVATTRQISQAALNHPEIDIRHEFSPEEFTDSDLGFVLDVLRSVYEAWGRATPDKPIIFNLPSTVERRPPNQVADMFEYVCKRLEHRECVLVSVHAHNDQGMGVAATELALLAGADRVEGALLQNGERTGNVDLVTVALNFKIRGVKTGLDFSNLPCIVETVERLTGMKVSPRHPYAGELAFTAFSGSHQDAIAKGMRALDRCPGLFGCDWRVPYLTIDPQDIGRQYDPIIRVNSQSGKGGIGWVLDKDHGIVLPKAFAPVVGVAIQSRMDQTGGEVSSAQLIKWFTEEFVEPQGPHHFEGYWIEDVGDTDLCTRGRVQLRQDGEIIETTAEGVGPIDAFAKALDRLGINGFQVTHEFTEGSLGNTSDAKGIAFMPLVFGDDPTVWWGVGIHFKTHVAAAWGIVAALNRRALASNQ